MARVAFYAPMKSPDSPKPSGDREMARNLMQAIGAQGDRVDLISDLRIYDKIGDAATQRALRQAAEVEARRLISDMPEDVNLWVTYHNYYKAPDLLGPVVTRARGLPYVQLESTRATSRLSGQWSGFAKAAHEACDAAQVIFYHTANDLITLERERYGNQALIELPPFLPVADLPPESMGDGPMLTVGMMRHGDKLSSYRILAEALSHLSGDWHLNIVGDGPARTDVEHLMEPFESHVTFLGQLDRVALKRVYGEAALFVWPGVNEAYGMVYLEAQAAGIPVSAQDRPGVRDVLAPAKYPSIEVGAEGLVRQIQFLLNNPKQRRVLGKAARLHVAARHMMPKATEVFWSAVRPILEVTV
ncbi:MAG: glycosyltransferase family 4 protein [Pseudomonadota bacterium]